jgi:hypothetical protein
MTSRLAPAKLLLAMQWSLSVIVFETGLIQAGLPAEELRRLHLAAGGPESRLALAGLLQALAGVLLVVPSMTGFLPGLAPLTAAGLAAALAAGGAGSGLPAGLGMPALDVALALGCAAVAVGRGFLWPAAPLVLGTEPRNPWYEPPRSTRPLARRWYDLGRSSSPDLETGRSAAGRITFPRPHALA